MSYNHPSANRLQRPLSVWDWIIVFFLLGIPIVGFLLMIYWSFAGDVNINKKNFSKATLIVVVLAFALAIAMTLLFGQIFSTINFHNPGFI